MATKSAVYNAKNYQYTVQLDGDTISVSPTSHKGLLNIVAEHCGYSYDDNATAVQLASGLIDFINLKQAVNLPMGTVIKSMQDVDKYFENVQQFADFIDSNSGTVYSWRNGSHKITTKLAKRALLATNGQVDLFEFAEFGG